MVELLKTNIAALSAIERTPVSPAALSQGVWDVLSHSLAVKAKVDSFNMDTGEYRVVLQGTFDREESRFEGP